MDRSKHTLPCLFSQLGLDNTQSKIDSFIELHKGIPASITLSNATIWTASQAEFLEQSLIEDADWAEVVDSLDCLLR